MSWRFPYSRSGLHGALRALLVVASLFALMGQSYIAIGCQVHDLQHCEHGGCGDTAPETGSDDCHPCCGSMSSGHHCAHGALMTVSVVLSSFAPQYALLLPADASRADAQFIPLGTFRPPASA